MANVTFNESNTFVNKFKKNNTQYEIRDEEVRSAVKGIQVSLDNNYQSTIGGQTQYTPNTGDNFQTAIQKINNSLTVDEEILTNAILSVRNEAASTSATLRTDVNSLQSTLTTLQTNFNSLNNNVTTSLSGITSNFFTYLKYRPNGGVKYRFLNANEEEVGYIGNDADDIKLNIKGNEYLSLVAGDKINIGSCGSNPDVSIFGNNMKLTSDHFTIKHSDSSNTVLKIENNHIYFDSENLKFGDNTFLTNCNENFNVYANNHIKLQGYDYVSLNSHYCSAKIASNLIKLRGCNGNNSIALHENDFRIVHNGSIKIIPHENSVDNYQYKELFVELTDYTKKIGNNYPVMPPAYLYTYNGKPVMYHEIGTNHEDPNNQVTSNKACFICEEHITQDVSDDPITKYLTFVITVGGDITWAGLSSNMLSYSIDNGETWSAASSNITLSVNIGDKVLWKGTSTPINDDDEEVYGIGTFDGDTNVRYSVEGNIMSLLYGDNFEGQTSLEGKDYAFYGLFNNNKNITSAENLLLSATTLAPYCYEYMFHRCTSLTAAPELPATTLADYCYQSMFNGCTSLTTAPELPATTLADYCYYYMFYGCTSLLIAPELPATTLTYECYWGMFHNCISLLIAPELPATTLAGYCYRSMFQGCTSLLIAPELPATTLVQGCYYEMFKGCTSLNSITCLATNISGSNCTTNWVNGVATNGTFTKVASMTSWTTGNSGILSGWRVKHPDKDTYLTFNIITSGNITWTGTSSNALSYSTDNGTTWSTANSNITLQVNVGDKILWKGVTTPAQYQGIGTFGGDTNVRYSVEGNSMSLLFGDNFEGQTSLRGKDYALYRLFGGNVTSADNLSLPATTLARCCYQEMFYSCANLTTVPKLPAKTLANNCYWGMFSNCTSLTTVPKLPATTLTNNCYEYMFSNCTSLTTVPKLSATTLTSNCYSNMFHGCTSLTTAPKLPATTLASNCYYGMFSGCTSLTTAPKLLATTLAGYCYRSMFQGCTSLTTAPSILPATTLTDYCYAYMFQGCANLITAPELPATTLAQSCYYQMFKNCGRLLTAPELPATTLVSNCYNYMFYDCKSLTTAPELPATKLVGDCYSDMFGACTNLKSITCLATDISASNCTKTWVSGVAANGTFIKNPSMDDWATGTNGMPSGWAVSNYKSKIDCVKYRILHFIKDINNGTMIFDHSSQGIENKEYQDLFSNALTNIGNINAIKKSVAASTISDTINNIGYIPIGGIIIWGGTTSNVPEDYLLCNGATIPTTYSKLISIVGTTTPNLNTGTLKYIIRAI